MREISFSIPVSGVIRIGENSVEIIVNRAETTINFGGKAKPTGRISFEPGITMFNVVLDTAKSVARNKGFNQFSAAELYHEGLTRYPALKRNSFTSHVIACSPNHPSNRHYTSKRDYFFIHWRGTLQA